MKKLSLYILLMVLPVISLAQSEVEKSDSVINYVINQLQEYWTVGIDSAGLDLPYYRTGVYHAKLFSSGATIDDDINAVYRPSSLDDTKPYKLDSLKSEELYAHDLTFQFKSLNVEAIDKIKHGDNRNPNLLSFEFTRKISGEKYRKFVFDEPGSLMNTLKINKMNKHGITFFDDTIVQSRIAEFITKYADRTFSFESTSALKVVLILEGDEFKIKSITRIGNPDFKCTNDSDSDGVPDDEDFCLKEQGDITANGCPDFDMDGVPDEIDDCDYLYGDVKNRGCPKNYFTNKTSIAFIVGGQANSVPMNLPELNNNGYTGMDFNESAQGKIKNAGIVMNPVYGAEFSYYFGKMKKTTGISLGANFTTFEAKYTLTEDIIYTFKANDGVDDYRRRVTLLAESQEEIAYNILNLPVLFKWRKMYTQTKASEYKVSFEFSAGPSYMMFQNISYFDYTANFEGLYQIDTITKNKVTYYDYFDNGSTYNILVTSDDIDQQSAIPGSEVVFNQLDDRTYDFAKNKRLKGTNDNLKRSTIAINAKFDGYYRMAKHTSLKFGIGVVYAPLLTENKSYKAIDKSTDKFNSIYNASAKTNYFAYAINVGFVLHW
ncbi:MAG: thrombospondin type 3 repeat-containing protein [Bacteroidetes bacterium]|nr:thrombospondin type 3 repeat-containing protein [Bacteroidota bacterium]